MWASFCQPGSFHCHWKAWTHLILAYSKRLELDFVGFDSKHLHHASSTWECGGARFQNSTPPMLEGSLSLTSWWKKGFPKCWFGYSSDVPFGYCDQTTNLLEWMCQQYLGQTEARNSMDRKPQHWKRYLGDHLLKLSASLVTQQSSESY